MKNSSSKFSAPPTLPDTLAFVGACTFLGGFIFLTSLAVVTLKSIAIPSLAALAALSFSAGTGLLSAMLIGAYAYEVLDRHSKRRQGSPSSATSLDQSHPHKHRVHTSSHFASVHRQNIPNFLPITSSLIRSSNNIDAPTPPHPAAPIPRAGRERKRASGPSQ